MTTVADTQLADLERACARANAQVSTWRHSRWGPTFKEVMADRAKAAQALRDFRRAHGIEQHVCPDCGTHYPTPQHCSCGGETVPDFQPAN